MDNYAKFGGVEINVDEKQIKEVVGNVLEKTGEVTGDIVEAPMFYTVIRLIFRYLIMGAVISIAGYYIPSKKPQWNEMIMLALTAASTMAILEIYLPDAYIMSRLAVGWTIGTNLIPPIV